MQENQCAIHSLTRVGFLDAIHFICFYVRKVKSPAQNPSNLIIYQSCNSACKPLISLVPKAYQLHFCQG